MSHDEHDHLNSKPFNKIAEHIIKKVSERMEEFFADELVGDSPIEQLLYGALACEVMHGMHDYGFLIPIDRGKQLSIEDTTNYLFSGNDVFVESQVFLLDWPVDFVIKVRSSFNPNKFTSLVVECDGHDFHERTKQQAARDRSRDRRLQAAGFTVFRFTGSEIWNDPVKVVGQIIDWADRDGRASK